MLKNNEYSNNPSVNKKLYDLFLKNFSKHLVRNDEVDLELDHSFEVPLSASTLYSESVTRRVLSEADS